MADSGSATEQQAHSRLVLYQVSLGLVLVALNHRAIQVALPTLTHVFHTDISLIQWVLLVYDLAVIGLVLTLGRLGDLFGRKWIYFAGFLLFAVASALCGLAQTPVQLVGFRAVQGIGGAMIMANGRALVTVNAPLSERGKALGLMSTAYHVGYMAGPTLGGFIIDTIGWRWIFHLSIPLSLACAYFGWRVLKERARSEERVKVDLAGAAFLLLANTCFIFALNQSPHLGLRHPVVFSFFIVSLGSLVLFIRTEQKAETPILSLSLFRNRLFTAANLSLFFITSTQSAIGVLMPFYLQNLVGFTPSQMGWIIIGGSVVIILVAPVAGWLSDRLGSRLLCSVGAAIIVVAQFLIGSLTLRSSIFQMVLPQVLVGLGWALFNSPNQSAILSTVPRDKIGAASGMTVTTARIGGAIGIALSGTILTVSLSAAGLTPEQIASSLSWQASPEIHLQAFSYTVHVVNAFALLSVLFAAMRGARKE
ncbi:MAG: MFS transporter [Deltaproteobacteria bacterium]|nr:MFS transporter [Deltaproteobacteria bacterium]MDZ4343672.1 MFS transporter [Candidatus Binatia bacterium]